MDFHPVKHIESWGGVLTVDSNQNVQTKVLVSLMRA